MVGPDHMHAGMAMWPLGASDQALLFGHTRPDHMAMKVLPCHLLGTPICRIACRHGATTKKYSHAYSHAYLECYFLGPVFDVCGVFLDNIDIFIFIILLFYFNIPAITL